MDVPLDTINYINYKHIELLPLMANADKAREYDAKAIEILPEKQKIYIKNVFFDFDKYDLTADAKQNIDKLYEILNQYPDITVRIAGNTDSKGNHAYNVKLAENRCQSAVDYLIAKGIKKKRFTIKSNAESMPIARNVNADGSDNPEGRSLNRRIEFSLEHITNKQIYIDVEKIYVPDELK